MQLARLVPRGLVTEQVFYRELPTWLRRGCTVLSTLAPVVIEIVVAALGAQ